MLTKRTAFVSDRKFGLSDEGDASVSEFDFKALLVNVLEIAIAELSIDLEASADKSVTIGIMICRMTRISVHQ